MCCCLYWSVGWLVVVGVGWLYEYFVVCLVVCMLLLCIYYFVVGFVVGVGCDDVGVVFGGF